MTDPIAAREETLPIPPGANHEQPEQFITEPQLREIALRMLDVAAETQQKLAGLAAVNPEARQAMTSPDQSSIDEIVAEITEPIDPEKFSPAAQLYEELDKPVKEDDEPGATLFTEVMANLAFATAPINRTVSRRAYGAYTPRCKKLLAFWAEAPLALSSEQMARIDDQVVRAIARISQLAQTTADSDLPTALEIDEAIQALESVDPNLDLHQLKFLVFGSILETIKQPPILEAYKKLGKGKEYADVLDANDTHAIYRATQLLSSLQADDPKDWQGNMDLLMDLHTRGRFMKIANRQFKQSLQRLESLGELYRKLLRTDERLVALPQMLDELRVDRREMRRKTATGLVQEALKTISDSYDAMIELQNRKIAEAASDYQSIRIIWEEASLFDQLKVTIARALKGQLQGLDLEVGPKTGEWLEDYTEQTINEQIERISQKMQLAELQPEIEGRLNEFQSVDNLYHLTNKQLRERRPEIIKLAKSLIDNLNGHNPLAIETARAVVGLMLGVYWERTGAGAPNDQLIQCYLEDATKLRQLSLELAYLGKPQDSQLLQLINLLDELIDSGVFDNLNEDSELRTFDDFLLDYLVAKDGAKNQEQEELTPETDQSEGQETTPTLPVETLRQALYEDIKVFPPSSTPQEVVEDYVQGVGETDMALIEWERIRRLIELRDQFAKQGLDVVLIRTKHASWQVLPFFVLEVKLPETQYGVAVVESPVYGNATYIYREADDRLPWRDVVQLTRQEARDEWGAVPVVHVDGTRLDIHFRKLWDRVISELTIYQKIVN